MKITCSQARKILLISQGLAQKHSFGQGKSGAYETIKKLGYIQIDTLSVIQRSHHRILKPKHNKNLTAGGIGSPQNKH